MATFTTGDNNFATAKWIVSPTAGLGTHITIASAITSASSGDTICIKPGTYTENLTLKAGVTMTTLASSGTALASNGVVILGKATATTAGTFILENITFQTNSDFCIAVTGSAATIVIFSQCTFAGNNSTIISHTSSSASSVISFQGCALNLATTGIAILASTSAGAINFKRCICNNTGLSTTASTITTGSLNIFYTEWYSTITTSSVASIDIKNSIISTVSINTVSLTHGGSGTSAITQSTITSGTATALTITATLTVSDISVSSSNATTIGGAGTIIYDAIHFFGTTSVMTVTTQTPRADIFAIGKFTDGAVGAPGITFSADTDTGIYRVGDNNMALVTAGASAILVSAAGEVTKPLQPAFLATASAQSNVTGDGTVYTVLFANEIFDQGGDFSSPTFTAPITGKYLLTATIALSGMIITHTSANALFVASNRSVAFAGNSGFVSSTAAGILRMSGSVIMDMDAADTCTITTTVSGGTLVVNIEATNTTFSASLIC